MKRIGFALATLAAAASVYACSSEPHSSTPAPNPYAGGHYSPYPSCNDIIQACHQLDVGEGDIHNCHDLGHAATEDPPCAKVKAQCLAICVDEAGVDAGSDASSDAQDQ